MLIKLVPTYQGVEALDVIRRFRPVIIFMLSNRKVLYYHCGHGKLCDSSGEALKKAERFISLYHKLAEAGPPKKAPFYICDCMSPGCPCKGNCNNIAVREIEYPDKHQQIFWLCENCLHEFLCAYPELEEEYGVEEDEGS